MNISNTFVMSTVIDKWTYWFSVYIVPLIVGLFTLGAIGLLPSTYPIREGIEPLTITSLEQGAEALTPQTALLQLAGRMPHPYVNTRLSEAPFWFSFVVPASEQPMIVEFPSRHAVDVTCWRAADYRPLGFANHAETEGDIKVSKTGFMLALGRLPTDLQILCKSSHSGPARMSANISTVDRFELSSYKFHRNSGLLDGGLIMLSLFVLLAAIVNREWLYVLFAVWLATNLRMAALSAGWDTQWLEYAIPQEWFVPMRKLTTATYYVTTLTLFARLFSEEIKQEKYRYVVFFRLSLWLSIPLLLAALAVSYSNYLPVLWGITTYTIGTTFFLLFRFAIFNRSKTAMWYSAGIAIALIASLNEVLAAAFDYRSYIGSVNSVTAALSSSLLSAIAIAEQLRHERQGRMKAQDTLRKTYEAIPIGLFTLDEHGHIFQVNPAYRRMLGQSSEIGALWGEGFEENAMMRLQSLADDPLSNDMELKSSDRGEGRPRSYLINATRVNGNIEGSMQDITERVETRDELIRSQTRLSNAQQLGTIGDWEWNSRNEQLICSSEMLRIFGIPPHTKVTLQDLLARVHPEDQSQARDNSLTGMIVSSSRSICYRIIMEDGSVKYLNSRHKQLRNADGSTTETLSGTVQDITEQKKFELDLEKTRDQLRTLSAYHETILERERKHMASEIHDELGQHLTAIQMGLTVLGMSLGEDSESRKKVDELIPMVSHTMDFVRYLATNLRPTALDLGLLPAIQWLAEDFRIRWDIECTVEVVGDPVQINDACATAVFRVVQESLTNVARHAQAKHVTISLGYAEQNLSLRIRDDGKGFDPVAVRATKAFGLLGMRERILSMRGVMHVETELNVGTTIIAEINLRSQE